MRAHLVQLDIAWEDPAANHEKVLRLLDRVDIHAGDLVLLPEMFDTGFSLNTERTADRSGKTLAFLHDLAEDLHVTVQGGRTLGGCQYALASNVMSVIGAAPGGAKPLCEYRKIHPFSYGREPEKFEGGSEVMVYDWGGARVCPAICYDLRFPELFRLGLLKGAEVFAIGACWPRARQSHWRALLIARAIENQSVVLGVNRTGRDPMLDYAGGTIAIGPRGEVLGELGEQEAVLSVEVDVAAVREWRATFPAWKDVKLIKR